MGTTDDSHARQIKFPKELDERLQAAADARMLNPHLLVLKATEKFLNELVPVETLVRVTTTSAPATLGGATMRVMKDDS